MPLSITPPSEEVDDESRRPLSATAFASLSLISCLASVVVAGFVLAFVGLCPATVSVNRATIQQTSKKLPIVCFVVSVLWLAIVMFWFSGYVHH